MMDEKMKAAFSLWRRDQEFPPMAHEIADWVLDYLRSQQEPVGCVGYLDIGIGGYIDIGSDLSDEDLLKLPPGRYALKPDGIFGVDGYRPIPSAPAVPEGWRLVPTELLNRAQDALARFTSDEGWGQNDMDTCDDLSAIPAAPSPTEKENPHD